MEKSKCSVPERQVRAQKSAAAPSPPGQPAAGAEPPGCSRPISRSVRRVSLGGSPGGLNGVRGSHPLPPAGFARRCFCSRSSPQPGKLIPGASPIPLKPRQTRWLPTASCSPRAHRPPTGSPRFCSGPAGAAPPAEGSLRPGRRRPHGAGAAAGSGQRCLQRPRRRAAHRGPMCRAGQAVPSGRGAPAGAGGRRQRRQSQRGTVRTAGGRAALLRRESGRGRAPQRSGLRLWGDRRCGARPSEEPSPVAEGAFPEAGGAERRGCPGQSSISRGAAGSRERRRAEGGGRQRRLPPQPSPAEGVCGVVRGSRARLDFCGSGGCVVCVGFFF